MNELGTPNENWDVFFFCNTDFGETTADLQFQTTLSLGSGQFKVIVQMDTEGREKWTLLIITRPPLFLYLY